MNTTTKKENNFIKGLIEWFGNNENATEIIMLSPELVKTLKELESSKLKKETESSLLSSGNDLKKEKKLMHNEINPKTQAKMRELYNEMNESKIMNITDNNEKERE